MAGTKTSPSANSSHLRGRHGVITLADSSLACSGRHGDITLADSSLAVGGAARRVS